MSPVHPRTFSRAGESKGRWAGMPNEVEENQESKTLWELRAADVCRAHEWLTALNEESNDERDQRAPG